MQGVYRSILAITVVIFHYLQGTAGIPERGLAFAGNFAVLGFYGLTGFLITMALDQNYAANSASLRRFALNRFLRIYPAYWSVIFISAAGVFLFPVSAQSVHPGMVDPAVGRFGWIGWIPQIFMAGLQLPPGILWPQRLIPPAWSTAIELYFYVLLTLAFFLPRKTFRIVTLVSLAIGLACALTGNLRWTYSSLPGVAPLFLTGSLAWRERDFLQAKLASHRWLLPVSFGIFIVSAFLPDLLHSLRTESWLIWGQYCVVPSTAIIAHWTVCDRRENEFTRWLAALSYPIFLAHFPVMIWVKAAGISGSSAFVLGLAATLVVAALIVQFVERPLRSLREKTRQGTVPVGVP